MFRPCFSQNGMRWAGDDIVLSTFGFQSFVTCVDIKTTNLDTDTAKEVEYKFSSGRIDDLTGHRCFGLVPHSTKINEHRAKLQYLLVSRTISYEG